MSDEDDFPDSPPAPRAPMRKGVQPSDFNDLTTRARYRALAEETNRRVASEPPRAECIDPMLCKVGDHAHRLAVTDRPPGENEYHYGHRRTWEWDAEGQAWKCITVHER